MIWLTLPGIEPAAANAACLDARLQGILKPNCLKTIWESGRSFLLFLLLVFVFDAAGLRQAVPPGEVVSLRCFPTSRYFSGFKARRAPSTQERSRPQTIDMVFFAYVCHALLSVYWHCPRSVIAAIHVTLPRISLHFGFWSLHPNSSAVLFSLDVVRYTSPLYNTFFPWDNTRHWRLR